MQTQHGGIDHEVVIEYGWIEATTKAEKQRNEVIRMAKAKTKEKPMKGGKKGKGC